MLLTAIRMIPARVRLEALVGIGVFALGINTGTRIANRPVATQVSNPTPTVQTVIVEKPVITERIVKQIIENPQTRQEVNRLLAQNAQLKAQVTALSVTEAVSTSHGEGPVVAVATPDAPSAEQTYHFKDYRLDFTHDGKMAEYTLSQRFEILQTTGRLPDGKPMSLVSLFEIDGNQQRVPIPATTKVIFANQTKMQWRRVANVQAGIVTAKGLNTSVTTGGTVGLQWLTRGRTTAAEDSSISLLTPVVTFGSTKEVGLLPASVNLGRIPHQPLKDIWASVYIGADIQHQRVSRIGLALTSTF